MVCQQHRAHRTGERVIHIRVAREVVIQRLAPADLLQGTLHVLQRGPPLEDLSNSNLRPSSEANLPPFEAVHATSGELKKLSP